MFMFVKVSKTLVQLKDTRKNQFLFVCFFVFSVNKIQKSYTESYNII